MKTFEFDKNNWLIQLVYKNTRWDYYHPEHQNICSFSKYLLSLLFTFLLYLAIGIIAFSLLGGLGILTVFDKSDLPVGIMGLLTSPQHLIIFIASGVLLPSLFVLFLLASIWIVEIGLPWSITMLRRGASRITAMVERDEPRKESILSVWWKSINEKTCIRIKPKD